MAVCVDGWRACLLGGLADPLDHGAVCLVIAVRGAQACDVHAIIGKGVLRAKNKN